MLKSLNRTEKLALAVLLVFVAGYLVQIYFATFGYTQLRTTVFDEKRENSVTLIVYRGRGGAGQYVPVFGATRLFLGKEVRADVAGPQGRAHLAGADDAESVPWDDLRLTRFDGQWRLADGERTWLVPDQYVTKVSEKK